MQKKCSNLVVRPELWVDRAAVGTANRVRQRRPFRSLDLEQLICLKSLVERVCLDTDDEDGDLILDRHQENAGLFNALECGGG